MSTYMRAEYADQWGHRAVQNDNTGQCLTLEDIMENGHVIRVFEDGSISDEADVYAPTLRDRELDDDSWSPIYGYSGQINGSSGFIMHNSEYMGGRLADYILEAPGLYACIVADWDCTEDCELDCDGDHAEGWAVVTKES